MADPYGNRVGGRSIRRSRGYNITAYRSRDCEEMVWSVVKKLDDNAEEGGRGELFCVLLSDLLLPGRGIRSRFIALSVMGTRTVPEKTDLVVDA